MAPVSRRSYDQFCPLARTLDLVGERWTLLVVRELLTGAKRYTDLRAGLPGIATDLLGRRLRDLEQAELVRRTKLPPPAASVVYELTDRGRELGPAVLALARFGLGELRESPAADEVVTADRLDLFLRVLFDRDAAAGLTESYTLAANGVEVGVSLDDGELRVLRDAGELTGEPAVRISADTPTVFSLLSGRLDEKEAVREGRLSLSGDPAAAARFVACFPAARSEAPAPA